MTKIKRLHRHKRDGFATLACATNTADEWWVGARCVERFTTGGEPEIQPVLPDLSQKGRDLRLVDIRRADSTTVSLRVGGEDRGARFLSPTLVIQGDDEPLRRIDLEEALGGRPSYLTGLFLQGSGGVFIAGAAGQGQIVAFDFESGELQAKAPAPSVEYRHTLHQRGDGYVRLGSGVQVLRDDFSLEHALGSGPSDVYMDGTRAVTFGLESPDRDYSTSTPQNVTIWDLDAAAEVLSFPLHRIVNPGYVAADPKGRFFVFAHGNAIDVVSPSGDLLASKQPRGKSIVSLAVNAQGQILVVSWKFTDVYEVVLSD